MSLSFYTYKDDEWRRISETYLRSGTIFKFCSPIRSFPLQLLFDKLPPQIDRLVGGQTSRFETSLSGKIVVQRLQYQQTPHQWFPPVTLRRKSIARERRKGRPSLSFYGQWRSRWTLREVAQTFYNELIKRPSAGQLPLADKYTRMRATRSRMIAEFCNKSRLFITSRSYSSFVLHLLLSHFSLLQEEIPFLSFPIFEFQGGEGDNCDVSCCNSTHLAFVRRERTGNSWRLLKKKTISKRGLFFSRHFIDDWKFHFHETRADFQLFQLRDSSYREIFRPGGRQVFCKRHVIKRL